MWCRCSGDAWRTIRIDGPGFGLSDAPRGDVQPDVYADAVIDILDALGIAKAFVAGCSWGGQIAAHLGARAPARVLGTVIMNAPLGPSLGGHAFELLGTRWFGNTSFWGKGVARSMLSAASRRAHPERVEALPRIAVPTAILMGAEDRPDPVERMRPVAVRAKLATLEIVPSCGHLAPLEAPEAVVASLNRLASASGMSGRP